MLGFCVSLKGLLVYGLFWCVLPSLKTRANALVCEDVTIMLMRDL
ncbi:hypothetical protein Hanom_Chr12g01092191 [Helianthus anomalus]